MSKIFIYNILILALLSQRLYAQQAQEDNIISIGLLVNDDTSLAAKNAADLAVDIANTKQDLKGRRFKVVTRSMEGSWGTGSKEAVNLVFNEKVWAILGSHDGRNAHLAEQVIAKTKVVLLSAWASDPTLTQAYVPWFYNCVPNDIQQAEFLVNEIVKNQKISKIGIIVQESYDAKKALKYLKEQLRPVSDNEPYVSSISNCLIDSDVFLKIVKEEAIEALIILGNQEQSLELLGVLGENGLKVPAYGTISMLGVGDLSQWKHENLLNLTVLNSGNWMKSNTLESQKAMERSNSISNAIAAYTFDGMNILINAIKSSGFDRDKFHETISKTNYTGVTGKIEFDKNGNRISDLFMVRIPNEDTTSPK